MVCTSHSCLRTCRTSTSHIGLCRDMLVNFGHELSIDDQYVFYFLARMRFFILVCVSICKETRYKEYGAFFCLHSMKKCTQMIHKIKQFLAPSRIWYAITHFNILEIVTLEVGLCDIQKLHNPSTMFTKPIYFLPSIWVL